MTRSTNRRAAAWLAGAVVGAGLLLSGCSAGQIAETARKNPSIQGVNAQAQLRDGDEVIGSVAVRDAQVVYPGPDGYEADGTAPVEMRIFNDTPEPVVVQVSPVRPDEDSEQVVQVRSVVLIGAEPTGAPSTPEPVASPGAESPAAPDGPQGSAPTIEIAAGSFVVLSRESGTYLRLGELGDRLLSGMSVPLRFRFSNGLELRLNAPVAAPVTPVPRATPDAEGQAGGH